MASSASSQSTAQKGGYFAHAHCPITGADGSGQGATPRSKRRSRNALPAVESRRAAAKGQTYVAVGGIDVCGFSSGQRRASNPSIETRGGGMRRPPVRRNLSQLSEWWPSSNRDRWPDCVGIRRRRMKVRERRSSMMALAMRIRLMRSSGSRFEEPLRGRPAALGLARPVASIDSPASRSLPRRSRVNRRRRVRSVPAESGSPACG